MSIALDSNSANRLEGSGFIRGLSCMIFDTPEKARQIAGIIPIPSDQNKTFPMTPSPMKKVLDDKDDDLDCCSSSSIGRNSDLSEKSDSDGEDDGEVQSSYKGPLDTLHDSLEECLPTKKGISQFYAGRSKSFTSLADAASTSSIKEIAKPDDVYTRKRKNLLATTLMMEKSQSNPNFQRPFGGGNSKRLTSSRRSQFSPACTPTSSSESIHSENSNTSSSSPPPLPPLSRLPPLHPQQPRPSPNSSNAWTSQPPSFTSRRAFSYSDLQTAGNNNHSSSSTTSNRDENDKKHH